VNVRHEGKQTVSSCSCMRGLGQLELEGQRGDTAYRYNLNKLLYSQDHVRSFQAELATYFVALSRCTSIPNAPITAHCIPVLRRSPLAIPPQTKGETYSLRTICKVSTVKNVRDDKSTSLLWIPYIWVVYGGR
jgi:hypothetical protein